MQCPSPPSRAAWIEILAKTLYTETFASPPSRAAWIEISRHITVKSMKSSPPSRAAWIEITLTCPSNASRIVAAFTGGVD